MRDSTREVEGDHPKEDKANIILTSMETTASKTAFSVRDILNMPECKEKVAETKDPKELESSMKRPSIENADRPPSRDKNLNEPSLKGNNI